jgi:soluble lytic murein transglycosylase-like protein
MHRVKKHVRRAMMGATMLSAAVALPAHGLELLTLRSGDTWRCMRHEAAAGDKVRVYVNAESYSEINAADIVSVDVLPDPPAPVAAPEAKPKASAQRGYQPSYQPTKAELGGMLDNAGKQHNIDSDLLASIVMAESGGQARAVSRTGAQGLMQLMPGTARELNVADSFQPEQNIAGGTQYLDALLTRYHDDIPKAVAAYNAGPAAVDRYHGIPPYHETQAYVARVVREFNRRKRAGAGNRE